MPCTHLPVQGRLGGLDHGRREVAGVREHFEQALEEAADLRLPRAGGELPRGVVEALARRSRTGRGVSRIAPAAAAPQGCRAAGAFTFSTL